MNLPKWEVSACQSGGGGGGGVLRFGLKGGAARASKPLPIFKSHFDRKGYPFLGIFLEM